MKREWNDLAKKPTTPVISAEMAKAVLSLNPSLGMSVEDIMSGRVSEKTENEPAPRDTLNDVIGRELAQLQAEEQRLSALKKTALDAVIAWLKRHDRDLLSPLTQRALAQHKAQLSKLGFSIEGYAKVIEVSR